MLAPNAEILRTAKEAVLRMTSRCLLDRYKIGFGKAGFPHAAGFNVVEVLKVVNSESEKRIPNPPKRGDSGRHSHERTGCKARRWSGKAGLIAKLRRNSAPRRSICRQLEQDLQYDKTRQCGKTEVLRAMPLVHGAQSS